MSAFRKVTRTTSLSERGRTYSADGGTDPAQERWTAGPPAYRRFETTVRIGAGEQCWATAGPAVLAWQVKTRSGFVVSGPPDPVVAGRRCWVRMRVGPVTVAEPVEVVAVVRTSDRAGFAYGTLEGHPVAGEEAFVVHRDDAGAVFFTLRSLTRPAPMGLWSLLFPVLLLVQRRYRRRYLHTMRRLGRDEGPAPSGGAA